MGVVIEGGRVWDGESEETSVSPTPIRVDRGKIAPIADAGDAGDDERIELPAGAVLIPGLIDAHVHMDLDPTVLSPDDQFKPSRADRDLRMVARARAMVEAGITTARDLGAGEWREIVLRDAIEAGDTPGPRLVCAGQPVTIPEGHCHFWGGVAATDEERRAVVERQVEHAVDWIKVMATGGVFTKGSGVDKAQFSEEEIREVVELAARHGRSVAAHCHGAAGIANAARAGVRTVEHCSFAGRKGFGSAFDPVVVQHLVQSGTIVSPTVNGGWSRRIEHEGKETDFHVRMRAVFGALRRAGVPMIASTDAGIPGVFHHKLAKGLAAFAHYADFTPREVLVSATSGSAAALGLSGVCGRIAPGLSADLVALPGDPLVDLGVLEEPLLVMAAGRLVVDPRGAKGDAG